MDRRYFLKSMGGIALSTILPFHKALAHQSIAKQSNVNQGEVFASAFHKEGQYGVALLNSHGEQLISFPLPDRGHDVAFSPDRKWGVVFARRPGNFALAFDPQNNREPITFTTPEDRHFYGHGVFSHDGKLLYATENDYEKSTGIIGIYDATDGFKRIGAFWSGGTGPHDILLLEDQKTLVVANGGIDTNPFFGRAKLNIDTMFPNIVMIDIENGLPLASQHLPHDLQQISLRHMTTTANGDIWIAGQKEGDLRDLEHLPLIFRIKRGEPIEAILLPPEINKSFQGYLGAITGFLENHIAVSAPRGNGIVSFDINDINGATRCELTKACGLAHSKQGFVASSFQGEWINGKDKNHFDIIWDNHIEAFGDFSGRT